LDKIGSKRTEAFTTQDWLVLDAVRRGQKIPDDLQPNLSALQQRELVERVGRGRGRRYALAEEYYGTLGAGPSTTPRTAVVRERNKTLLVEHLTRAGTAGSDLSELMGVLPSLTRNQMQKLLSELKAEGRVRSIGRTRAARWYA
jgi:hypothetical protein